MANKARYAEDGKLIQNTAIKVRLYPTERQAELFDKTFGCCRYIWNRILADEQTFYAATDEHFLPTPAKYKAEAPFLKEVDSGALCTTHQNLRQAFQKFFSKPEHYGYPCFKKKKDRKQSYTTYCQRSNTNPTVYLTENGIRLPKAGIVKASLYRKPLHWWTLKSATVSKSPSGKYFCSLLYEYTVREPAEVKPTAETTLGLNYSMAHFYVDSAGRRADPPKWLRQSQEKLTRMQRKLARMEHDSNNYNEQLRKLQLLYEHIANQRKDFVHQESRRIANAYDAVCVRDADLREMAKSMKFGNVMDSGFGKFRICLEYKLARQGKQLLIADRFSLTARTCSSCGSVNEDLTLRDRTWICPDCGAVHQREENAAKNIKNYCLTQVSDELVISA